MARHQQSRRPGSKTYSDAFLIVAPGITIRDRLQVLKPADANNIYQALDLVPPDLMDAVKRARIVITNFHAFQRRTVEDVSALNKQILAGRERDPSGLFRETAGEMVARVAPELMNRRNIIVLNDEAHHCYQERIRPDPTRSRKNWTQRKRTRRNEAPRRRGSGSTA